MQATTVIPSEWAARLIARLEAQRALVRELASLATRQRDLIHTASADALLGLLEERQSIIDRFVEGQQAVHRASDERPQPGAVGAGDRSRIRTLIDTIEQELAVVIEGDEADRLSLENVRLSVGREIDAMGTAHHAHRAYGTGPTVKEARFADRRG